MPAVAVETCYTWTDPVSGDVVIQSRYDWIQDGKPCKAVRWPRGSKKAPLVFLANLEAGGSAECRRVPKRC